MARGRMVNRTIAKSRKFHKIRDDFSRLVYLLLLPFADRDGRLEGNPRLVYFNIFPLRTDLVEEDVSRALEELSRVNLITWYTVDEESFIEIVDFSAQQQGLHYNREAVSAYPPSSEGASRHLETQPSTSQELLLINSGSGPAEVEVEVKEKEKIKEKIKTARNPLCVLVENLFLEQNGGQFSSWPKERKAIQGLVAKAELWWPTETESWLVKMIVSFAELREAEEFFKKHPFLPSSLNSSGIWDRVKVKADSRNNMNASKEEKERKAFMRQQSREKDRLEIIREKELLLEKEKAK